MQIDQPARYGAIRENPLQTLGHTSVFLVKVREGDEEWGKYGKSNFPQKNA
jgi:hypothetical protein